MSRALRSRVRALAALTLLAGLAAFVLVVRRYAAQPLAERPARASAGPSADARARAPFAFRSNNDCRPCHEEIWQECAADQHSQAWFNEPFLPQDPKSTECVSCHASEPILETGLEAQAVIRTARFEEGIGCIECHRDVDHVEGPLASAPAACNPVENAAFASSNVCNPCHAWHGSFAEWSASSWPAKGLTCQGCHMPLVERASATGGPPRKVRSHRMRTQRDPTMLAEAMTLEARLEGRALVVSLVNSGTGHALPGEIYNRELFVATRVADAEGHELARHREVLKAVRREQRSTETSTQLQPGERRTWTYPLPAGTGVAEVEVGYKLFFMMPDEAAEIVHAQQLAF